MISENVKSDLRDIQNAYLDDNITRMAAQAKQMEILDAAVMSLDMDQDAQDDVRSIMRTLPIILQL